jgi:tetratricopeptide (TPR) repeat protein
MKKTQIILLVLAAGLLVTIYSLPKVVVDNAEDTGSRQGVDLIALEGEEARSNTGMHMATVSQEDQSAIDSYRRTVSNSAVSGEINDAATALIELYSKYSKYDSAAFYADRLAFNAPTDANVRRAAFLYYDAFSFAIDPVKASSNREKALQYLDRILEKFPNDADATARKGMIMVASPQPMQGILMVRGVLEQNPDHEFALLNMGLLSIESGQFGRAVDYLERYTERYPENEEAFLYLGMSYLENGNRTKAQETLNLLEQKTTNTALLNSIDDLRKRLQ